MTRRISRIFYAALLLLTAAAWLVSSSAAAAGAAVFLLLLPVISFGWNALARRAATVSVSAPSHAEKGEAAEAALTVRFGRVFVPAGRVYAVLTAENELTGTLERFSLPLTPNGRNYTARFTFSSAHCGCVRICAGSLALWDAFCVLPCRAESDALCRCTVLPQTFPVEIVDPALPNETGEADAFLPVGGGSDFTQVYQLREYVPGDAVRGIHWLLSAKTDALIYRDPALSVCRSLLLFWDKTKAAPDVTDALAEAVFSVAQALAEQGIAFTLAVPQDGELQMEDVETADALAAVLPLLLRGTQTVIWPQTHSFGRTLWFTSSGRVPDEAGVTAVCCFENPQPARGVVCTPQTVREALQRLDWDYEG